MTTYFEWILYNQLAMGSKIPSEEVFQDYVEKQGITHILDLEKACDLRYSGATNRTPRVLHMYFPDDSGTRPEWYWMSGFEFARQAMQAGGVVFVHCKQGKSRGPSMTYGILKYINALPDEKTDEINDFDRTPKEKVFPEKGGPIYQAQIDAVISQLNQNGWKEV